ncbi:MULTISPECIES: aldose epimerase family protein [Flavobacteriaceae]|uniref:aldose epimerase family protein n=1 Tax=Flavobacteriaceae TaxID=49546 RepID=UPI0014926C5B|nr:MULTISPECIES: aldose epimerase family protein [Allomuricauda]MDC6365888.1 galactose mutarotase [Muricauda sp. AC10]
MRTAFPYLMYFAFLLIAPNFGCKQTKKEKPTEMDTTTSQIEKNHLEKSSFGEMPDGKMIDKYTLSNDAGMEVDVITYGGIITRWTAPDRNGNFQDVVLGFNDLESYLSENPYFGALIGRYGNRIAKGKFDLDGKSYTLITNNGENHLHGGDKGFDKVVWNAKGESTADGAILELTYRSADGEEGYPGTLDVKVTYTLTADNELDIAYEATTDKPTIVNLTQHTYFNLSADFTKDILDHELQIDADNYLPVDDGLIPTGEFASIEGTPFDFKESKLIGKDITSDNLQIKLGGGFDHCWVLNGQDKGFRKVSTAYEPKTGRVLEVYTNEPGIQFYSGNFLDSTLPSKNNGTYGQRSGFCLETQHYPDSPNQDAFPSVRLDPGETYTSRTAYKLLTK